MREEPESTWSKMEVTILSNLILEVLSHHLCCILFVRTKSLGPTDTQEEGIIQGSEYQEHRSPGAILDGAYHSVFMFVSSGTAGEQQLCNLH